VSCGTARPGADAEVRLGRRERHDLIRDAFETLDGVDGRRRHGHDDACGRERSRRDDGGVHRGAGGHAVVDDDDGRTGNRERRATGAVRSFAALELLELTGANRLDLRLVEAELLEQLVVVDGHAAVSDGAERELGIERRAELAYNQCVDRCIEGRGNLARHRYAAAR
jgi:hypothetical protein